MATCLERIYAKRGMGGHNCSSLAVTKAGYCKLHDPELKIQREGARTKCAYVYESSGIPACDVTVRDSFYCARHGEEIQRFRTESEATAQRRTLLWLESLGGDSVNIDEVIDKLTVTLRNK